MSGRQITGREFAALTFRILGVVILVRGLAQSLFMLLSVAQGDRFVWGLLSFLLSLVYFAAVALPLVFYSEWLAEWLFSDSDKTIALAVSRRDLLMCGFALLGAWILATNLQYAAQLAGQVNWNGEGNRPSPRFFSRFAFGVLGSIFACVAGWVLFRYAGRITDWWESRVPGKS